MPRVTFDDTQVDGPSIVRGTSSGASKPLPRRVRRGNIFCVMGETATIEPSPSDLKGQLLVMQPEDFASYRVLDRLPHIFPTRASYIDWKSGLATGLSVDPFAIVIVGSAATGQSLNPLKNFSPFTSHSDVDVAVVSARHFDEAWRWLRELGPLDALAALPFEKEMLRWHRSNLVFDGTIATERLLDRLPFGATWTTALARASAPSPINGRIVKARIYRDFESLRNYHVRNITKLQSSLVAPKGEAQVSQLKTLSD